LLIGGSGVLAPEPGGARCCLTLNGDLAGCLRVQGLVHRLSLQSVLFGGRGGLCLIKAVGCAADPVPRVNSPRVPAGLLAVIFDLCDHIGCAGVEVRRHPACSGSVIPPASGLCGDRAVAGFLLALLISTVSALWSLRVVWASKTRRILMQALSALGDDRDLNRRCAQGCHLMSWRGGASSASMKVEWLFIGQTWPLTSLTSGREGHGFNLIVDLHWEFAISMS